jgi:hypothetical protein
MEGWLDALETFGPAAFLRTSFWLYPIVNATHVLAIGALVTAAVLMDMRVLGLGRSLPLEPVIRALRPVAIVALVIAALSGLTLFSVQPRDYLQNTAFLIKMGLLVLALVNAALFTSFRAHRQVGAAARSMAFVSALLWISVAVAGRFIGYLG